MTSSAFLNFSIDFGQYLPDCSTIAQHLLELSLDVDIEPECQTPGCCLQLRIREDTDRPGTVASAHPWSRTSDLFNETVLKFSAAQENVSAFYFRTLCFKEKIQHSFGRKGARLKTACQLEQSVAGRLRNFRLVKERCSTWGREHDGRLVVVFLRDKLDLCVFSIEQLVISSYSLLHINPEITTTTEGTLLDYLLSRHLERWEPASCVVSGSTQRQICFSCAISKRSETLFILKGPWHGLSKVTLFLPIQQFQCDHPRIRLQLSEDHELQCKTGNKVQKGNFFVTISGALTSLPWDDCHPFQVLLVGR